MCSEHKSVLEKKTWLKVGQNTAFWILRQIKKKTVSTKHSLHFCLLLWKQYHYPAVIWLPHSPVLFFALSLPLSLLNSSTQIIPLLHFKNSWMNVVTSVKYPQPISLKIDRYLSIYLFIYLPLSPVVFVSCCFKYLNRKYIFKIVKYLPTRHATSFAERGPCL